MIKKTIARLTGFCCAALTAVLCLSACMGEEKTDCDFEIIYTTDVHGSLLDVDFLHHNDENVSMANVMTYVKLARDNKEQEVILLDDGDILQGDPSMYYYNVQAIRDEHLATRVYNYMGYDAITIGNHDFECGEAVYYDHFYKNTHGSVLGANCIDTRSDKPMFDPYTIIERSGFRIAVLGITNPGVPHWISKSMFPHLRFESMQESTQKWIDQIRQSENPDMLVVMFHAGHEKGEYIDEKGEVHLDYVEDVIRKSHGIDLALIGHDHKWDVYQVDDASGASVKIVEPKSHAQQFASIKFHLKRDPETRKVELTYNDITLEDSWRFPPDQEFSRCFAGAADTVNAYLDTPLGSIVDTLHGRETLVGQSNLMDLIHEVQLNKTGADISMASALSSFADVPAGDITMRQLFDLYKYENQLNKVWMTGREVLKFLNWGYGQQFSQMQSANDHLLSYKLDPETHEVLIGNFGPELTTPQYNFTSAAGINYVVDVTKPADSRVTIEGMADGTPFDLDRRYIVVLTSYQASGGGGFIRKGLGWSDADIRYHAVTESIKDMRYFIGQYIRNTGIVRTRSNGHWRVVPEDWWKANIDRDVNLLLPYIKH